MQPLGTEASPQRVVRSVLSPARAATREKLLATVITLADEIGYDEITMRKVAASAGVSVPTAYQHAGSKDELLMLALMSLGERSTAALRERPPVGETPAARLSAVFSKILHEAARRPLLYQALYRGYIASGSGLPGFGPEQAAWIGETLRHGPDGDASAVADDDNLESSARMLSMMFLGAMIGVASGRDPDEVSAILTEATERLLS